MMNRSGSITSRRSAVISARARIPWSIPRRDRLDIRGHHDARIENVERDRSKRASVLSIGLTGMPRGTSVRLTSTPSGRCAGMDVLPSAAARRKAGRDDGAVVHVGGQAVRRFLASSLETGRTFTGTRVRGIIEFPVEW